jgi:monovalent cation/hydrogen antiporter
LGLVVGWIIEYLERWINDGPIEIALSILIPYTVYLAAEKVHSSGVLAVVACGLFLSRRSARFFSPSVRIQIWSVWKSLNFVLNGFVFVLIGLQLPAIRASIGEYSISTLMIDASVFSAVVILLRLVWVFPGAGISWLMRTRVAHQDETPPRLREIFVIGWTGMRGVVSLAATLSLPVLVADGSPFPQRNLIVFLTFCVILVTLVVQGLTLPHLIDVLGLAQAAGPNCEETEARRIVTEAAIAHLEDARRKDVKEFAAIYDDLIRHYHERLVSLQPGDDNQEELADYDRQIELSLEAVRVEREAAIRLRDEGRINDEVLRSIERELDLNESRIAAIGDA